MVALWSNIILNSTFNSWNLLTLSIFDLQHKLKFSKMVSIGKCDFNLIQLIIDLYIIQSLNVDVWYVLYIDIET